MWPRALTASSGLAPWSMAVDRFGSVKEKSNRSWGSRGLAPLVCLPLWGREGATLAISTPAQKTRGDFYKAKNIIFVCHTVGFVRMEGLYGIRRCLVFKVLRLQEPQQGFDTGNLPLQYLFMKILS